MKLGVKTTFWEERSPHAIWFQIMLDTLLIAGFGILLYQRGDNWFWIISAVWVGLRVPLFISYHKWERQQHGRTESRKDN